MAGNTPQLTRLMDRLRYSLLLLLLTPLLLLYFAFRAGKSSAYRGRIAERFGFKLPKINQPIVVHCASMGETLAAVPLIRALQQHYPQESILVTTTTPTGSEQVKQQFGDSVAHCYLPLDLNFASRRFVEQLQPKMVVLLETELWPNLIHHCQQQQTPVILANGRLSERSAAKYAKWPKLVSPMLHGLSAAAIQDHADADRFITLGLAETKISVCGSLKFDIAVDDVQRQQAKDLGNQLWQERPSWIAASTHPVEFEQVLAAHQQLLIQQPDLLLLLVPRHPEQFAHAAQLTQQAGLSHQRRSEQQPISKKTQVLIGDSMGELKSLYGASDIAFVGGSLIERGGHNPLEPIAFGKPTLMGPHYFNFAQICDALRQQQLLIITADSQALALQIEKLLSEPETQQAMQTRALTFMQQNQGATHKQLAVIKPFVDSQLSVTASR